MIFIPTPTGNSFGRSCGANLTYCIHLSVAQCHFDRLVIVLAKGWKINRTRPKPCGATDEHLIQSKLESLSKEPIVLSNPEVVIVGGGIAGLCCARRLHQEGIACLILEGSDAIGGRIRTDSVDGFLLDRGFQTLLTSYPEAQKFLDFPSLDLHSFFPGALIRLNEGFR